MRRTDDLRYFSLPKLTAFQEFALATFPIGAHGFQGDKDTIAKVAGPILQDPQTPYTWTANRSKGAVPSHYHGNKMFTTEMLLEMAAEQEAIYRERSILFPPGTVDNARNDARQKMDDLIACATWMDCEGVKERRNIGPFQTTVLSKGSIASIPRGTPYRTTHPSGRGGKIAKRKMTFKVHNVQNGYVNRSDKEAPPITNGTAHWAGTGGYWCWVDIELVIVED